MLIQSFGLFWDRSAVEWSPGAGNPRHLWARRHKIKGTLRVADVWEQKGLYVLYSNTGPYYVGIASKLGKRLADHTRDEHSRGWLRFSWFGFHPLTNDPSAINVPDPGVKPQVATVDVLIKDMEALLIKSMGTFNLNNMNFNAAKQWEQITHAEADAWLARISG